MIVNCHNNTCNKTDLNKHLNGEDDGENVVGRGEEKAFCAVRGDVGAFHCKCDAIEGNEH